MTGRINGYLVVGGWWHDFDFARLELLKLLAEDDRIRVKVAHDYESIDALSASDFLISYTCNVRPSDAAQQALSDWVTNGGRWFALHGTNSAIDPPTSMEDLRSGLSHFTTPRAVPTFSDTLGSQFLSHPHTMPFDVTVSPGAEHDPLVDGIEPFTATGDELYLCEYHEGITPLLETRFNGHPGTSFAEHEGWETDDPRLIMYRRPRGAGEVLYLTLGHCRSHWDMEAPPFNGARYHAVERGSWELAEFFELVRRGIVWAKERPRT